jgi:HK97 family phage major capsid protein
MGTRIRRGVANHLINGTGTGQPTGLLTNVRTGATGVTGETVPVAYADLVNLIHAVDPAYRQGGNCKFLTNDLTLEAIQKLVDTTNRPLWSPGYPGGIGRATPQTILGYPFVIDNAMPIMAANAKSIAFGDFKAGYVVRQVQGVQVIRLDERYADFLQTGWQAYARFDGIIDDGNATACFVNSAT